MHLKGLDLNLLVALDALLRERSVTRAGERLGLSQSTMSGAAARLREYFNDALLVPVVRTVMVTPRAASLLEPVAQILRAAETLHENAWQLHGNDVDAERCESIARDASRIYAMSQAQAHESQRTVAFADSLVRLETGLSALLTTIQHEMEVDTAPVAAILAAG